MFCIFGVHMEMGERECMLSFPMATKNTWVGEHVYLMAIWPVIRHGHQSTLILWPYGKMLDQTQKSDFKKNLSNM